MMQSPSLDEVRTVFNTKDRKMLCVPPWKVFGHAWCFLCYFLFFYYQRIHLDKEKKVELYS